MEFAENWQIDFKRASLTCSSCNVGYEAKNRNKSFEKNIFYCSCVFVADQFLKFWIKTMWCWVRNFRFLIGLLFILLKTTNGLWYRVWRAYRQNITNSFRIIVVGLAIYYLRNMMSNLEQALISVGLIMGGAIGNIIDSVFYGVIFNDSYNNIASFLPEAGGYAPFLQGKVVDMFYFPLINTHFPNWLPFFGGEHFIFFRPVFNIADAGISIGIILILLFYQADFR